MTPQEEIRQEIEQYHPNNHEHPNWELWNLAEALVHERDSKADIKALVYCLLLHKDNEAKLIRYNADQIQDRCENAYVEVSRWDAALQALAEVAPEHPLLKGGHPNYGVWTMMRKQLESIAEMAKR